MLLTRSEDDDDTVAPGLLITDLVHLVKSSLSLSFSRRPMEISIRETGHAQVMAGDWPNYYHHHHHEYSIRNMSLTSHNFRILLTAGGCGWWFFVCQREVSKVCAYLTIAIH